MVLGFTINWWHPGWIIVVGACMVSAIVSIVTNMVVELKKSETENKEQEEKSEEK